MFLKDTHSIGIAGDWHGNKAWAKIALLTFHSYGINTVIHVGDFGFWPGNSGQKYLYRVQKQLAELDINLLVTLGNHEDYVLISRFRPHPEVEGYVYQRDYPNILVATRGARWEWEGVSFVSLGGANSIDKFSRTEWLTWWAAEQISLGDVYATVNGGHAQVMISHDCPIGVDIFGSHRDAGMGWSFKEIEYAQQSRIALRQAVDGVKPDILFHGHYHMTLDLNTTLNDGVLDYDIRTVGMNQDGSKGGNLGILSLPDMDFQRIPVETALISEFYRVQPVFK